MPFVTQERRDLLDQFGPKVCESVGDICYLYYKEMVTKWKNNPRWTTIHDIKRDIIVSVDMVDDLQDPLTFDDAITAAELAFDVFFIKYGMPYELQKIKENGDIT